MTQNCRHPRKCGQYEAMSCDQYVLHTMKYHSLDKNYIYECKRESCSAQYDSLKLFKQHLIRKHKFKIQTITSDNYGNTTHAKPNTYNCPECNCILSINQIMIHMNTHFKSTQNDINTIDCDMQSIKCIFCDKMFTKYKTFESHMYKFEKMATRVKDDDTNINDLDVGSEPESEPVYFPFQPSPSDDIHLTPNDANNITLEIEIKAAEFLIYLESILAVPVTSIDLMIQRNSEIFSLQTEFLLDQFTLAMTENDLCNENVITNLKHDIRRRGINVFEGLNNDYKRKKFYTEHFNYMVAKELKFDGIDKIYYASPIETIRALCKDDEFITQLLNIPNKDSSILEGISDGYIFKNKRFFEANPNAIQIELYIDDYSIANNQGSARYSYKFQAVYFTIGNLENEFSGSRDSVFYIMLIPAQMMKKYEPKIIFKNLLDDFRELRQGIVTGNNIMPSVKGALSIITGDNLSQNGIGGFIESFTGNIDWCRFCELYPNMLRTKESYDIIVKLLEAGQTGPIKGIKRKCIFNDDCYHCIEGNFHLFVLFSVIFQRRNSIITHYFSLQGFPVVQLMIFYLELYQKMCQFISTE